MALDLCKRILYYLIESHLKNYSTINTVPHPILKIIYMCYNNSKFSLEVPFTMKKKCTECNLEKGIQSYKTSNSTICNDCKRKAIEEKMKKFSETNLGVDALDKNLEYITRLFHKLAGGDRVTYDKAVKLVNNGFANVYAPDTIYMAVEKSSSQLLKEKYERVRANANYICHYCGGYGNTVDHIIPKAKGGTNKIDNLVCSCFECNLKKRDMDYDDFIKIIQDENIKYSKPKFFFEMDDDNKRNNQSKNLDDMIKSIINKPKW